MSPDKGRLQLTGRFISRAGCVLLCDKDGSCHRLLELSSVTALILKRGLQAFSCKCREIVDLNHCRFLKKIKFSSELGKKLVFCFNK